jgi:UDP-N-acetylglucosamine--N-acetylmuramyl-(pentapeptide) pyrophosphoryl-undecaprenol N-acetylglucosamine transferase
VYPALVIRQALGSHADSVLWVGSEGGMEEELVQRTGTPYTTIPAGQVAGMGPLALAKNLVKVVRGTLESRRVLQRFKPDCLLFTGGYVAVPMALAGRGIPSLVYVPDIEPGIALKQIARFASVIAVTTETSRAYFPAGKRIIVTGYPTRPDLTGWDRAAALSHLGLQDNRFTLLVTGGSTGARSINRAVLQALPQLLQEMQVIHLSGKRDWAEVEAAQKQLPAEQAEGYRPYPYLHEMGAALTAADLVLSRAGASAIGEYPLFGLPAVLVPYPYAWRYQKVNAEHLAQKGAALILRDEDLQSQLLPVLLDLARDPQRLGQMGREMKSLARPNAASQLAELVLELASVSGQRERVHG